MRQVNLLPLSALDQHARNAIGGALHRTKLQSTVFAKLRADNDNLSRIAAVSG
jgi:hypothetical protein